jgi:DMSO/TMAO reductase YedYZ molybdopterin-dependent catalytic subunit
VIEIGGAVAEPFAFPLAELATLPRHELNADFHCVAGWSATDLRWEGVAFETFHRQVIEPSVQADTSVTHVVFRGLDGYWSYMTIEDALAEDVLIADRLDGRPLDSDHGAPARLVSPSHYGFINTKHLCRIEVRSAEPRGYGSASSFAQIGLGVLGYGRPPRARVWEEERHRYLPAWSIRLIGRLLIPPIASLSAHGSRRDEDAGGRS